MSEDGEASPGQGRARRGHQRGQHKAGGIREPHQGDFQKLVRGLNGDFLSWQVTGWEGKGWVWEPMWVPRAGAPWVVSGSAW